MASAPETEAGEQQRGMQPFPSAGTNHLTLSSFFNSEKNHV
jgi:hypothetical protein